jgi:Ca2+-binding RTX toxin-like protein
MQYLNWNGTFLLDSWGDEGTPGDPPTMAMGGEVFGLTNYDIWGNHLDANTVIGTPNADLIFLDRAGYDTTRLVNVTEIYGGDGDDLIDLTSARFNYSAVKLVGGSGNDAILSNSASDRLYGQTGADTLKGYGGSDYLNGGDNNDHLYGGRGNDKLIGGSGHDYLRGEFGKDVLTGGKGIDRFVFDVSPAKANVDTITDFSVRDDTVHLARSVFTKAGPNGGLKAKAFWSGSAAHDSSDRVIYDKEKGYLYYDPDGTGNASQVTIAKLSKNLEITHRDFFVL